MELAFPLHFLPLWSLETAEASFYEENTLHLLQRASTLPSDSHDRVMLQGLCSQLTDEKIKTE